MAARRPCGSPAAIVRTSSAFFIALRTFAVVSTGVVSEASIGFPSSIRVALPPFLRNGIFCPSGVSWTKTPPSRHALSTAGTSSEPVSASLPINSTCSLIFEETIAFANKFRAAVSSAQADAVRRIVMTTNARRILPIASAGRRRNNRLESPVLPDERRPGLFRWQSTLRIARNLLVFESSF